MHMAIVFSDTSYRQYVFIADLAKIKIEKAVPNRVSFLIPLMN